MIDLVNLVDALNPELLRAATVKVGLGPSVRNMKPLLRFVADKTNKDAPQDGCWWSLEKMSRVTGETTRKLYRMRKAAETIGLLLVNSQVAETLGEKDKPSELIITNEVVRFVDPDLYLCVTGTEWTDVVIASWMTICHPPSDTLSPIHDVLSEGVSQYVSPLVSLCHPHHVTMSAKTEMNQKVIGIEAELKSDEDESDE